MGGRKGWLRVDGPWVPLLVVGAFEGNLYFETFLLPDGDLGFLVAVGFRGTSGEFWGTACIPFDFLHSAAVSAFFTMLLGQHPVSTSFSALWGRSGVGGRERRGEARILRVFYHLGGPRADLKLYWISPLLIPVRSFSTGSRISCLSLLDWKGWLRRLLVGYLPGWDLP